MINSVLVIAAASAAMVVVFHPRLVQSTAWRATVTPLASIIGSGFLVLGPILKHSFGVWAIAVMFGLCVVAWLFGHAIRFNIACYNQAREAVGTIPDWVSRLEVIASYALVLAYVVSISYYLNLFGAFALSLTPLNDPLHARIVTTAMLALVVGFGWLWGFAVLERIEEGTVGLKLAIIAGLLVGLCVFVSEQILTSTLPTLEKHELRWESLAVALGLVITVQGFETSRYLGGEFDAETRIRTMSFSQWISTAIYMGYILLVTFCFTDSQVPDSETGIIGMTAIVAPVLPAMLVAAALAAQFSAAVADTGGCGGLAEEVTSGRVKAKTSYLFIGGFGIALTWFADIYSIIAWASRAFAAYYALQCAIATVFAAKRDKHTSTHKRYRAVAYGLLVVLALSVAVMGRPAE